MTHVCWAPDPSLQVEGRCPVVSKLALGTLDTHAGLAGGMQETCGSLRGNLTPCYLTAPSFVRPQGSRRWAECAQSSNLRKSPGLRGLVDVCDVT